VNYKDMDITVNYKMPVPQTGGSTITLSIGDDAKGVLSAKDGLLAFEGDADAAAKVFFDGVVSLYISEYAALRKRVEELQRNLIHFGVHRDDCRTVFGGKCNCGWDILRGQTKQALKGGR